jgi:hypothetical protein
VFAKENVKNLIQSFNTAVAGNEKKVLEFKDFRLVLSQLFSDIEEESTKAILDNGFFLKRIYSVMDVVKPDGGLNIHDFINGIGLMFSGEDEDLCKCKNILLLLYL